MEGSPALTEGQLSDVHERLGRAGFVAKGILYGIVAIIAAAVALGDEKSTADQSGALGSLADNAAGTALLVVLAVGLGAMALFRLAEVFTGPAGEDDDSWVERVVSGVRFVIYGALFVTAIRLIAGSGKAGSNEDSKTSTVFDLPAGVVLVFAVGAVIIGVGIYQGFRAVTTSFEEELETARMSSGMRKAALVLGVAGHGARAVVFLLIGAFLIKAAVEYDPKEAVGLDGALQEIAQQAYGSIMLFATAAGLFVYGAYCLIEARYRKL
jgi:hypothetical protein